MFHRKYPRDYIPLAIVSYLLTAYIAIKIAPYSYGALFVNLLKHSSEVFAKPLSLKFCSNTPKVLLACSAAWLMIFLIYVSSIKYRRPGEEYGSATWADVREIRKKFAGQPDKDRIFTKNVSMSHDFYRHQLNLLTVVIGGSGAGKTTRYVYPNILQANTSLIVTDPKGEIIRNTGKFLEMQGYDIKILDLIDMGRSHLYNPFKYVRNEEDIEKLCTIIMLSTREPGGKSDNQFWEDSVKIELHAYISYLLAMAPEEEQNLAMVLTLLRNDGVDEDDEKYVSPTNMLFNRLKMINPNHVAVMKYEFYKSSPAKTVKSIQAVFISRLASFSLEKLQRLTMGDELDLASIGRKKTALFAVIPDTDKTFNFLVSILYMQLFQQLFAQADASKGGRLPVPVHMMMDEFANIALPPDFERIVATMRSRLVMVSIILQSMSQLKALYKDNWESIIGNCDEWLYLGGNEPSTHKALSEKMGKETVNTSNVSKTTIAHGNSTKNDTLIGRELLAENEVGKLRNTDCLLFIRGEDPVRDKKYDVKKHPNVKFTPINGNHEMNYKYGETKHAIGNLQKYNIVNLEEKDRAKEMVPSERFMSEYAIYSAEELEKIYGL